MVEQLWQHSLDFLDNYRQEQYLLQLLHLFYFRSSTSNYGIDNLYSFDDKTGILFRHKETFENKFLDNQVGI